MPNYVVNLFCQFIGGRRIDIIFFGIVEFNIVTFKVFIITPFLFHSTQSQKVLLWLNSQWLYKILFKSTHDSVMAQNIPCSFISFFLHNKDIFCYFGSFLVYSGRFQLASTISTTFLLVDLMVIKHGHHIISCSYWQPWGGCFSDSWCSPSGCAVPPTLLRASNITSNE